MKEIFSSFDTGWTILCHPDTFSTPPSPQAELKKELIPLKKNLRHLYEAKQECDDTTVHMKVSINTKIHETLEEQQKLLLCKHINHAIRKASKFSFREPLRSQFGWSCWFWKIIM